MSSITTTAVTLCACCVLCSVIGMIAPNGGSKKIFSLILGVFLLCSVIMPIKNAVTEFRSNIESYEQYDNLEYFANTELEEKVIKQTGDNLVISLNELYRQNSLSPKNITASVSKDENNNIIIDEICIYISNEDLVNTQKYKSITEENAKITPKIISE